METMAVEKVSTAILALYFQVLWLYKDSFASSGRRKSYQWSNFQYCILNFFWIKNLRFLGLTSEKEINLESDVPIVVMYWEGDNDRQWLIDKTKPKMTQMEHENSLLLQLLFLLSFQILQFF